MKRQVLVEHLVAFTRLEILIKSLNKAQTLLLATEMYLKRENIPCKLLLNLALDLKLQVPAAFTATQGLYSF